MGRYFYEVLVENDEDVVYQDLAMLNDSHGVGRLITKNINIV
jgi:hypothetical protein